MEGGWLVQDTRGSVLKQTEKDSCVKSYDEIKGAGVVGKVHVLQSARGGFSPCLECVCARVFVYESKLSGNDDTDDNGLVDFRRACPLGASQP